MEVEGNEEHSLIVDDLTTNTSELSLFPTNSLVNSFNLNAAADQSQSGATANKLPGRGVLDGGDLKQESIADGNGKFVRVLQRPLPMMGGPLSGRYMPERVTQEAPDTSLVARPRAGHRKKTLSLNPEEREALENLVEEVLIGGFEEAAIDSDSNSDDDEQVRASGVTVSDSPAGKRMGNVRTDTMNVGGSLADKNKEKNDNKNGKPTDQKIGGYASKVMSNRERERQFAREFGRNIGPRNSPKEFVMPPGGNGSGSQSAAGGGRDFGRRKDNNGVGGGGGGSGSGNLRMKDSRSKSGDFRQSGGEYGGRAAPGDHRGHEFRQSGGEYRQQPSLQSGGNSTEFRNQSGGGGEFRNSGDVRQQQSTDFKMNKSPGSSGGNVASDLSSSFDEDKDKLGGVRGVNIYPAQLKVAIKHMDSLPPRFLRRLQSGNMRAGVGSIEADQLLMSRMEPTILESPSKVEDSPTSAEKERGAKSKQTQLQETKKSIRNLLGDLDQYTDEGVIMTPVSKDAGVLFPGNLGARAMPPTHGSYGGVGQGNVLYRPPDGMGETGGSTSHSINSSLFYGPQQAGGGCGAPLNLPPPLPTTRQRVLSCEELEKELLHSGGGGMMHSGSGGLGRAPPNASQQYPGEFVSRGFHSIPPSVSGGGNEFYGSGGGQMMPTTGQGSMMSPLQHTTSSATAASAPSKKTKFSVNAPEFISNRFASGNITSQQMTTENSEMGGSMLPQYYQQAPGGMMGGQQQHQFNAAGGPNSLMMPQSSEFINIPSGASRSSMQSPYQIMSYDPSSMAMIRNSPMTSAYMLPGTNPSGGAGNMMPYHRHAPPPQQQYAHPPPPPSYGHSSAGYPPQFTPAQFTPPQFTPPPPSFMQPNMVGGALGPMRWMVDTSKQMGGNPPPPPLGPWYPPAPPPRMTSYGGGGSMYVRNNAPDQQGVMMAPDEGGYVMVDPSLETGGDQVGSMMGGGVVENGWGSYDGGMMLSSPYEVGRQKVLRLLSEGNCVMVILIGGPDGEKMNLVNELQTQSSGALVLNMRNGLVNGVNASKMKEIQDWNYKQAIEAVEARKSPVIIDYAYEQDWEINDYINLGQQHGYMVEVIDANEHTRQFAENELNCQYDSYQIQQPGGMYATNHQMAANDVYITHQTANNAGMYQTDINAGRYPVHPISQDEVPKDLSGAPPQSNL